MLFKKCSVIVAAAAAMMFVPLAHASVITISVDAPFGHGPDEFQGLPVDADSRLLAEFSFYTDDVQATNTPDGLSTHYYFPRCSGTFTWLTAQGAFSETFNNFGQVSIHNASTPGLDDGILVSTSATIHSEVTGDRHVRGYALIAFLPSGTLPNTSLDSISLLPLGFGFRSGASSLGELRVDENEYQSDGTTISRSFSFFPDSQGVTVSQSIPEPSVGLVAAMAGLPLLRRRVHFKHSS